MVDDILNKVSLSVCLSVYLIQPKMDPISVVFHNLRDTHHLMQMVSQLQKEVKCIANNMDIDNVHHIFSHGAAFHCQIELSTRKP